MNEYLDKIEGPPQTKSEKLAIYEDLISELWEAMFK